MCHFCFNYAATTAVGCVFSLLRFNCKQKMAFKFFNMLLLLLCAYDSWSASSFKAYIFVPSVCCCLLLTDKDICLDMWNKKKFNKKTISQFICNDVWAAHFRLKMFYDNFVKFVFCLSLSLNHQINMLGISWKKS